MHHPHVCCSEAMDIVLSMLGGTVEMPLTCEAKYMDNMMDQDLVQWYSKSLPMSLSSTAMVTLEHGALPDSEGAVHPDSKTKMNHQYDTNFPVEIVMMYFSVNIPWLLSGLSDSVCANVGI